MKRVFLLFILILLSTGCNVPTQTTSPEPQTITPANLPENTSTVERPASEPSLTPPTTPSSVTTTATSAPQSEGWVAYAGLDGNLWLINPISGEKRQLTNEATGLVLSTDRPSVIFSNPQWSPDGALLAFTREDYKPQPESMLVENSLWLYDISSGQARSLLALDPAITNYAWQPGTHVLTYTQGAEPGYFARRGQADASLARGIMALDVDNGQNSELVPPVRGYQLRSPLWSPDGSEVCFEEVVNMEGRGPFACYTLANAQYHAWEYAIGSVNFSPDSRQIAYDYLNYAPSGDERIYLNDPQGKGEVSFSPNNQDGYAFEPIWSPQGDQIAYIGNPNNDNTQLSKLFIQGITESYPREVGQFESPRWINWSPNGQQILMAVGPYQQNQVLLVDLSSGAVRLLDQGMYPTWQPQ